MNMVSGLFRGHPIHQPPSPSVVNAAIDELAEYLATDLYSLPEIARRMNVTFGTACVLLRLLCERMGEAVSA